MDTRHLLFQMELKQDSVSSSTLQKGSNTSQNVIFFHDSCCKVLLTLLSLSWPYEYIQETARKSMVKTWKKMGDAAML